MARFSTSLILDCRENERQTACYSKDLKAHATRQEFPMQTILSRGACTTKKFMNCFISLRQRLRLHTLNLSILCSCSTAKCKSEVSTLEYLSLYAALASPLLSAKVTMRSAKQRWRQDILGATPVEHPGCRSPPNLSSIVARPFTGTSKKQAWTPVVLKVSECLRARWLCGRSWSCQSSASAIRPVQLGVWPEICCRRFSLGVLQVFENEQPSLCYHPLLGWSSLRYSGQE